MELHHQTTARLPQELFDLIIGELEIPIPAAEEDSTLSIEYRTLKACALTTRAFTLPSQMKLFARVDLQCQNHYDNNQVAEPRAPKFSKLLELHPHVAQHVKILLLCHHHEGRSPTFNHILSALPSLQALYFHLYPVGSDVGNARFPSFLKGHLMPALSLASLRHLELGVLCFENASVLESLLSESVGLEHLILDRIEFVNTLHREDLAPGPPRVRVVLNSLRLVRMDERAIRCILSTFTVVDIKHLRWFTCDKSDLNWMLEANGRSIQRLEILGYWYVSGPLKEALPADNRIRSLVVGSFRSPRNVVHVLRAISKLAHFNSLRTLTLRFYCRVGDYPASYWSSLDQSLVESGDGHGPNVAVAYEWFETTENGAQLRKLLPLLDQKGVLKICPPGSSRTMFPY
ncbi:hypothetical protein C8J57DRAFT_125557 [Mycena rebaudengoi]|nr:hypothetical protein C8J57DRAFT_125557 [Mycena rebaudengoi]